MFNKKIIHDEFSYVCKQDSILQRYVYKFTIRKKLINTGTILIALIMRYELQKEESYKGLNESTTLCTKCRYGSFIHTERWVHIFQVKMENTCCMTSRDVICDV